MPPVPILLLLLSFPLSSQDETVAAFRRYFPTLRETPSRVEAILSLEGVPSIDVVEELLPLLADRREVFPVREAAIRVLSGLEGEEAVARLAVHVHSGSGIYRERLAKNAIVREAACRILGLGRRKSAVPSLLLALEDRDETVRIAAAEALGRIGDPAAVGALVGLASDREVGVRRAVVDALGAIGDPGGEPVILAALADREWTVRAAAAAAADRLRSKAAIPILIRMLREEEGRLVDDAARALKRLTVSDFGMDPEPWERWWSRFGDVFKVPSFEEIARLEERRAASSEQYRGRKTTSYHGIVTPSKRLLFVIDISGSMEDAVIEKDRFRERGFKEFRKIDIVAEELSRTIENLEANVRFNILAFATALKPWRRGLVPANLLNRKDAVDWAKRLEPIGGASAEGLAGAGLVSAAGLEGGRTNTFGALLAALGVAGADDPRIEDPAEVDTVFFLSDGRPSVGEIVDPDEILVAVNTINEKRKIVLHVVAIGEFQKNFLQSLAMANGGQFVDLGR